MTAKKKNVLVLQHIGLQVEKRRKKLGITQEELADALGVSRVNICNFERGVQNTTLDRFYKLCCALSIQPSELFPKISSAKRRIVIELNPKSTALNTNP